MCYGCFNLALSPATSHAVLGFLLKNYQLLLAGLVVENNKQIYVIIMLTVKQYKINTNFHKKKKNTK